MAALELVNASWVMIFGSAFTLPTCFYLNFNERNNEILYLFYQTLSQQEDTRRCKKILQNPCRGIVTLLTATEYVSLYLQVMQSY